MATAMTLTSKSLYVVVQKSGEKGTTPKNVVCSYDLPGLLRSFDETWDKCQNVEDVNDVRDVTILLIYLRVGVLDYESPLYKKKTGGNGQLCVDEQYQLFRNAKKAPEDMRQ